MPALCLGFLSTAKDRPRELTGPWFPPHFPLLVTRVSPASFAHEALEEGVLWGEDFTGSGLRKYLELL